MRKRSIYLVIAVVVVFGVVFAWWRIREAKANAARIESETLRVLTEDDIRLILENQATVDAVQMRTVVETFETRKVFLDGLKEYLAVGARARREGLADDENVRLTCEFKKNALLADLYFNKLVTEQQGQFRISDKQIDEVWLNSANEAQFNRELTAIRELQKLAAKSTENPHADPGQLSGEALEKTRKTWARTKIVSDMAKADRAFLDQRAIYLRLKIVEAGVLSSVYLNQSYVRYLKPTTQEMKSYLANHPEFDLSKKRERAAAVLRRAQAGEDFDQLVREVSEDRATKNSGGMISDLVGGGAWPEIQQLVYSLEKGQFADKLVETKDGYHIVQLLDKEPAKTDDGRDTIRFSMKHILFQRRFEEPGPKRPNVPAPFMTPDEIARTEVQREKRQQFVAEIVTAERISLPADFQFELTDRMKKATDGSEQMRKLIEQHKASEAQKQ